MTERHADNITLDHYIKIKNDHDQMIDILNGVAKWLKDLEIYAEPGYLLHPSLKRVVEFTKRDK
jgi:hypothetical protein